MMSLLVLLVVIGIVVAGSGALMNKQPNSQSWLIILGFLMLLPGLCGSFFLGVSFLDGSSSAEARAYMTIFTSIAVPSIQLSCFLLWLLARKSDVVWFRKLTRAAGWFGAAAALILVFSYVRMALDESDTLQDRAMVIGIGLLIAIVPFLIGGLQAIRLKAEVDTSR